MPAELVDWAAGTLKTTVEIVGEPAEQRGFAVQPERWVVIRRLDRGGLAKRQTRHLLNAPE
ncbi:hypothetical protein [Actinoplanes sp. NPDC051411]|uniref:hypothetical protein n=1 Tax=Actinoplanes sp. NPDC051411 TaxID=3155522 RepID=UPI003438FC6A